ESAGVGAFAAFVVAALYGRLNREMLKKVFEGTLKISGMILLIVAGSAAFSQILAFTGATRDLINFIMGADVSATMIVVLMLLIVLILGCFIDGISIMMITIPFYIPM